MNTKLVPVKRIDAYKIDALLPSYIKEMIPYLASSSAVNATSSAEERFAIYFTSETHWPYFILGNEDLAGFCLIRRYPQEPETYDIEQFFILNEYKRHGLGRATLKQLVELHPGNWLVRILKKNSRALAFWTNSINAIVGDKFTKTNGNHNDADMDFIRFNSKIKCKNIK